MAKLLSRLFRNKVSGNVNENEESSASQKAKILAYLQEGNAITSLEALQKFNSLRLGARIADLRADGWPVESRWYVTPTGKRVKQYFFTTISE